MKQLLAKCFGFSIRAVELSKYLDEEKKPFPLCNRLITCALFGDTSITHIKNGRVSAAKK